MLGLHGDLPMNLTNVVKNDWRGHTAVVSGATMAQARELSRNNNTVELPKSKHEGDDTDSATNAKLVSSDGTVGNGNKLYCSQLNTGFVWFYPGR